MENIIIVSQAFHHLEKCISLKNKVLKDSVIYNFHQDKAKLSSLRMIFNQEYIKHFDTPEIIDFDHIQNVKAFVFLSFSPHLSFIKFIYQIRKAGKKIIFFQDNHQFSIHQGSVNSMIFSPHLIVTASESEKKYLIDNGLHSRSTIVCEGWLFKRPFEESKSINKDLKEKKILIVFAAPIEITLGSSETQAKRADILLWISKNFPDYQIIIKLHPHEDNHQFMLHIKNLGLSLSILPSQSSINQAIESAEIIVSSNESQAPLDVLSQDINKRLLIYCYKKENFIKNKTSIYNADIGKSRIQIGEIESSNKKQICDFYLGLNKNAYSEIEKHITNLILDNSSSDFDSMLEIYLWLYIYGHEKLILSFLENQQLKKYKNLKCLLLNKDFNLIQLKEDFVKNTSRDPLSIILVRHYLSKSHIVKTELDYIVKYFFKESLFQYFFRDLIRLNNLVTYKISDSYFQSNYKNLIENIKYMYISKFKPSKIFFSLLQKIYYRKIFSISSVCFYISDRILRI
ncbi:hypothetical protein N9O22_03775 [Gammaproteobacteria bacterium]|nr:hypothetical protein [Gammaproteobacteria bacterium]